MPRLRWMILLSLASGVALAAGAPVAPPAGPTSAPATTQAAIPSDQSTPRGALKLFTIAMNQGDADTVRAILQPENPTEQRMVDALIAHQQAILKLREAAKTAFGVDGMKRLTGDVDADQAESIANIAHMPETINGDTATVGDGDSELRFKKVNGKWVLPISSLPNVDFSSIDQVLSMMKQRTQLFGQVTAGIADGKYKSADEAAHDLQLKLLALAMKADATQPASTQPDVK